MTKNQFIHQVIIQNSTHGREDEFIIDRATRLADAVDKKIPFDPDPSGNIKISIIKDNSSA